MEGDPDAPENSRETEHLVPTDGEGGDELVAEVTTLLSEMPGHSGPTPRGGGDEGGAIDPSRPSETSRSHPHPYHLKNKYTFRSDSVYSDVVPISAAPNHHSSSKTSEPREKSGSLSSLKAKESKWASLKKKIGRLNSSSSAVTSNPTTTTEKVSDENQDKVGEENKRPALPSKSLNEKRSLFQRAKTLSILPVHRSSKDKDDTHHQPQPKRVMEPPELFNVGGEMNLIPLELLIDVNTCSGGMRK